MGRYCYIQIEQSTLPRNIVIQTMSGVIVIIVRKFAYTFFSNHNEWISQDLSLSYSLAPPYDKVQPKYGICLPNRNQTAF